MSVAGLVGETNGYLKESYRALEEIGGDLPENPNLANLAPALDELSIAPSLAGLKKALQNGTATEKYPVATEIEDTYNGNSNPLIVAQYLDSNNNSSYGGAEGVILVRKYVEPIAQVYATNNSTEIFFPTSLIKTFLDTTYLSNCSDELRGVISSINIPCLISSYVQSYAYDCKWFLMSTIELYGKDGRTINPNWEGIPWEYWKEKTGFASPSNGTTFGRICRDRSGNLAPYWTRTARYYNGDEFVSYNGNIPASGGDYRTSSGVLPACFISKN